MSFTAKSVILDVADNWGDSSYMGLMSVDFWLSGSKVAILIDLGGANFTPYATSELNTAYHAENLFDITLPKTGDSSGLVWRSAVSGTTNQRLICVFDDVTEFDEIRINNHHHLGTLTNYGAKNTVISISPNIVTDTTYAASSTGMVTVFDGVFNQHTASNVEDEQILTLGTADPVFTSVGGGVGGGSAVVQATNRLTIVNIGGAVAGGSATILSFRAAAASVTVKSVIIDIADNWGDASYLALRSVDFYLAGVKIDLLAADFTSYATSEYSADFHAENVFDTSLSKTGGITNTSWSSVLWANTNQRLICVFDVAQTFDTIDINNNHEVGSSLLQGAKNIVISISASTVTDTTYAATSAGQSVFFGGVLDAHVASDVEDPQLFTRASISLSVTGNDGAVAGGSSNIQTNPMIVIGVGGAVAGGETLASGYWFVGGNLISQVPQVVGLADTTLIGNGKVVALNASLTGFADTTALSWGNLYQPRVRISDSSDVTGSILSSKVSLSGTATTSIQSYGAVAVKVPTINSDTGLTGSINQQVPILASAATNFIQSNGEVIVRKPVITAQTGMNGVVVQSKAVISAAGEILVQSYGSIKQNSPSVSAEAITTVIANSSLAQQTIEISGEMLAWPLMTGRIKVKKSVIVSTSLSSGYVYGNLLASSAQVSGIASNGGFANGSIIPIKAQLRSLAEFDTTSDIIKYSRGCPTA